jgi:hypothetical protein
MAGEKPYPMLQRIEVELDTHLSGWAVFPGRDPIDPDDTLGPVLEGRPFGKEYVELDCDGDEVHLRPHYEWSLWDDFWVDGRARVRAKGLARLFPCTLGRQEKLLRGFLEVLAAAAQKVGPSDPRSAQTIEVIIERIGTFRLHRRTVASQAAPLPRFRRVRIRTPIQSADWTIWPDVRQGFWEWVLGHPFELAPFRHDFLDVSCDGRVKIKPHYDKSTWDTFWVDRTGQVEVEAFGGLFPVTLGAQPRLLEGILTMLAMLPGQVPSARPAVARNIEDAIKLLIEAKTALESAPPAPWPPILECSPGQSRLRAACARRLWRWKLRKPRHERAAMSPASRSRPVSRPPGLPPDTAAPPPA